jgi:methylated-DNA-[protein]-cysteine S-methyltransferase
MKADWKSEHKIVTRLRAAIGHPPDSALIRSRARVRGWFERHAPAIGWGAIDSPLGAVFVAATERGVCAVDLGRDEGEFLQRLGPLARLEKDSPAVKRALEQLRAYFSGERFDFDLPVDLSGLTAFQRAVLDAARRIAPGQVRTYHQLAKQMGRPKSSRPVGQALARNPVPVVIPCHRVIASDGSLGGYSGGSGLQAKRWLLRLEGALS